MGAATRVAGRRRAMQMAYKVARLWLPCNTFLGLDNNGTDSLSLSQGTPAMSAMSGPAELCSIPMTTADEIHTLIPIPWDMDISKDMAVRVVYVHASTDADADIDWKVGYKFLGRQETVPEVKAGVDKDVTLSPVTCSTTNDSLETTDWTNLETATYQTENDIFMAIAVELDDDGTATGDEPEFVGIELAYQRNPSRMSFQTIEEFVRENPL